MRLNVGVNTAMFDGHDTDIAFATIFKAGFHYVELAYNQGYVGELSPDLFSARHADKILSLLEKHRLATRTLGATMDLAADNAINAFSQRIKFASMIGARRLTVCLGRRADQKLIIERLKMLSDIAAANQCIICIENGGDHNYNVFETAKDGYALLDAVNSPALAFNIDAGNMVSLCPEMDAIAESMAMLPSAAHCHIKDVKVINGEYYFPAIGEGILNYPPLLNALADKKIPCSLEIPLRMHRNMDSYPVRAQTPVPVNLSLEILKKSRLTLESWLTSE
ncbi:sugar phosphate isomerase/epimerase [Salmonella enterica]|nr:sugar phosphate isomerase/epimerase [Salmonella enterica]EJJ0088187.1 sugar phosphate isomerase/epimerase [Salmonella enterica]EJJ0102269.1 sugar phosphate isomerase/epimerase [Salmonella enterica]EJJ3874214.1 sugar phosphate isomerase/epimerase [Salmonella enterica]EJJ4041413.1 sugar phosphate isomerase/epimerase [Salmonella enterica]